MPNALVDDVARLGTKAGLALEIRFVNGPGWDEQRLVRLGVLVKALEAKLANMPQVWTGVPHAVDYPVLLQGNGSASPGFDAALGAQQVAAIEQIVRALDALTEALNQHGSAYAFKAIPQATLRVRPSI